jgi:Iap family predicted aminopeptidase
VEVGKKEERKKYRKEESPLYIHSKSILLLSVLGVPSILCRSLWCPSPESADHLPHPTPHHSK